MPKKFVEKWVPREGDKGSSFSCFCVCSVFAVILAALTVLVQPPAIPLELNDKITYDLKDIWAPELYGLSLLIVKNLLKVPFISNILASHLKNDNEFYKLDQVYCKSLTKLKLNQSKKKKKTTKKSVACPFAK